MRPRAEQRARRWQCARPMRKLIPLLLVSMVMLPGCSAMTAEAAGVEQCEKKLQYEIEQAVPAASGAWLDSELSTSNVQAQQRDNDEVEAFNLTGHATVKLANGRTVDVTWSCFAQRADGKDYAAVMSINGMCSTTYTGHDATVCKPRE